MFCYLIDIRTLSYYENDVHIVKISNGKKHLSCYVISYQVLTHTKRGPSDPWIDHLSFCLKPLIYMDLSKTDHALVNHWGAFLSPELYLEQI